MVGVVGVGEVEHDGRGRGGGRRTQHTSCWWGTDRDRRLERRDHLLDARESRGGHLGSCPLDDVVKGIGQIRAVPIQVWHSGAEVLLNVGGGRWPREGALANEQLIEKYAQSIDIGLGGHGLGANLLRCGVGGRAKVGSGEGGIGGWVSQIFGNPEVG